MKWFFTAATLFVMSALAWIVANPFNGFGVSFCGLTTYDLVPIPWADVEVRADGSVHLFFDKARELGLDDVRPALVPPPDVLIVATGWRGELAPRPEIRQFLQGYNVEVLRTGEALALYNQLVSEGKRVAIRVRST